MNNNVQKILFYWFGDQENEHNINEHNNIWWAGGIKIDTYIKENFEGLLEKASIGMLSHWNENPKGRLALIILLDQFPRNIYRSTPQAFSYGKQALEYCLEGIKLQHDKKLLFFERGFFYLPLAHSENIEHQELCVTLNQNLINSDSANKIKKRKGFLNSAIHHKSIIQRFGRFPHRNKILSRKSSPEEAEFLNKNYNSFGQ